MRQQDLGLQQNKKCLRKWISKNQENQQVSQKKLEGSGLVCLKLKSHRDRLPSSSNGPKVPTTFQSSPNLNGRRGQVPTVVKVERRNRRKPRSCRIWHFIEATDLRVSANTFSFPLDLAYPRYTLFRGLSMLLINFFTWYIKRKNFKCYFKLKFPMV